MLGSVWKIFVAPKAGQPMVAVDSAMAMEGRGLDGDRYAALTGHWKGDDGCQVSLIENEAIEAIRSSYGVSIDAGEHRRNIVTQGVDIELLTGRKFRIGEAVMEFDRARPPCGYIASLTSKKMTKALWGRSGICARIVRPGLLRVCDTIELLDG